MRNINCGNIRREIEEAAPGKWLSSEVKNHVSGCVACETLLREQTKLRELVSSLGTVEAPSDFDFRLRARLANEKRAVARPAGFGNFSLGLRSASVATVVLLVGSAFMFVNLRNGSQSPVPQEVAKVASTDGASSPVDSSEAANPAGVAVAGGSDKQAALVPAGLKSKGQPQQKRRDGFRQAVASQRDNNRQSTRTLSSTAADILRRDQLAGVYPTSAFPIDGGYQSLKVSLDDGRGVSRTISLPTVSFGSQRSLSQSGSPLMASARGAW